VYCAGPNGGVAKAIAEVVRPSALAAYQEALASVFTSSALRNAPLTQLLHIVCGYTWAIALSTRIPNPHADLLLLVYYAGPNGGVAKAIAEVVRPAALAAYQEALASVLNSTAEARHTIHPTSPQCLQL
jgi:hypothetical protein